MDRNFLDSRESGNDDEFGYTGVTLAQNPRNNLLRYCPPSKQGRFRPKPFRRQIEMIAIAAGAAFVGLFALWVIVPRFILRRHEKAAQPAAPMTQDEFAPQAAD